MDERHQALIAEVLAGERPMDDPLVVALFEQRPELRGRLERLGGLQDGLRGAAARRERLVEEILAADPAGDEDVALDRFRRIVESQAPGTRAARPAFPVWIPVAAAGLALAVGTWAVVRDGDRQGAEPNGATDGDAYLDDTDQARVRFPGYLEWSAIAGEFASEDTYEVSLVDESSPARRTLFTLEVVGPRWTYDQAVHGELPDRFRVDVSGQSLGGIGWEPLHSQRFSRD